MLRKDLALLVPLDLATLVRMRVDCFRDNCHCWSLYRDRAFHAAWQNSSN